MANHIKDFKKNEIGTKTKRESWIDIVRGIGSVFVIIGHSSCPSILQDFVFGFHIPLFFILSGYLHNQEKWSHTGGGTKYFCRKLKSLIIPYFIFSLINLAIDPLLRRGESPLSSFPQYIRGIIYSSSKFEDLPNCTPLWFLPALFISSIIIFFILQIKGKQKFFWISIFCVGALTLNVIFFNNNNIPIFPWHIEVALVGTMYMIIGYYIKQLRLLERTPIYLVFILLAIGSVFNIINGGIDMNTGYFGNVFLSIPASVLIPFFIMSIFYRFNLKDRLLNLLGKNSMFVMAFNYLVNALYVILFMRFGLPYNWLLISGFNVLVFVVLGYLRIFINNHRNKNMIKA